VSEELHAEFLFGQVLARHDIESAEGTVDLAGLHALAGVYGAPAKDILVYRPTPKIFSNSWFAIGPVAKPQSTVYSSTEYTMVILKINCFKFTRGLEPLYGDARSAKSFEVLILIC
jgi:hypothetical protein